MKSSIVLVVAAFLCLVVFPTTAVGKNLRFWPKPIEGWPRPSEISRNDMFVSTSHNFNYGDSKIWKCVYSNGSGPAISISFPSPSTPTPKTSPLPPTPSPPPPTPKTSPPPPTPSPPPPTPKQSPPPPTPSLPPPTPKKSPSPPPSLPPPTPKISPSPPPSLPPPTPKKSPSLPPPIPSLPPPTPKKSPSPSPPSHDESSSPSQPSNPPPEHHDSHHHRGEYPWEHFGSCMRDMGPVGICRGQMEFSFFTKMFQVSEDCCNLMVDMKNDCDDVIWGYFTDPFFVPLVRCTCHVTY